MTPQLAERLKIHEEDAAEAIAPRQRLFAVAGAVPAVRPVSDVGGSTHAEERSTPALARESLRRRLLALADVMSAMVALVVVLNVLGRDHAMLSAFACMPLLIIPFKIVGLYDHDELRLVHSTLDEAPMLAQLTGLFALGVTIFQPVVLEGALGGAQIAALWFVAFMAIVTGRMLARYAASRLSPAERCLVIGDIALARQIRAKLASSQAPATVVATLPLAGEDVDALADPESIRHVVRELNVDRIVIAPTTTDGQSVVGLIRLAKSVGVHVSVLPRMFEGRWNDMENRSRGIGIGFRFNLRCRLLNGAIVFFLDMANLFF